MQELVWAREIGMQTFAAPAQAPVAKTMDPPFQQGKCHFHSFHGFMFHLQGEFMGF